jgi:hypothetical protein
MVASGFFFRVEEDKAEANHSFQFYFDDKNVKLYSSTYSWLGDSLNTGTLS